MTQFSLAPTTVLDFDLEIPVREPARAKAEEPRFSVRSLVGPVVLVTALVAGIWLGATSYDVIRSGIETALTGIADLLKATETALLTLPR